MSEVIIPNNVYYSAENDNFYSTVDNRGMGNTFYYHWRSHKDLFPAARENILSKGQSGVEICSNLFDLEKTIRELTNKSLNVKCVTETQNGNYIIVYQNL